jgi:hypothetical protein
LTFQSFYSTLKNGNKGGVTQCDLTAGFMTKGETRGSPFDGLGAAQNLKSIVLRRQIAAAKRLQLELSSLDSQQLSRDQHKLGSDERPLEPWSKSGEPEPGEKISEPNGRANGSQRESELDELRRERHRLEQIVASLDRELDLANRRLEDILESTSWRWTSPARFVIARLRKLASGK